MYVNVLVQIIASKDKTFTYKTKEKVMPGMRVLVPFK
jgi:primosomal protein N'